MRSLLRLATQHGKLKLLALALAVLLWIVVSADQVTSNWIPVPLEVRVADPEYALLASSVPDEVQVRFTGPGRELLDLGIRRPPLRLLITDVKDTLQSFRLAAGMVETPNELSVNAQEVRPGLLRLRFRRLASKSIPVRVQIGAGIGEDRALAAPLAVEPRSIRITGVAGRVAQVSAIPTLPIDLSAVDSTFDRLVLLDTAALPGLQLSTREVRVSGRVDPVVERPVGRVPVSLGPGVSIEPEAVDVRLRGPESLLRSVTREDFRVVVSIDSIPAQIPPEGVVVPLAVENLDPRIEAQLSPSRVRMLPLRIRLDSVARPQVIGRPIGAERRVRDRG